MGLLTCVVLVLVAFVVLISAAPNGVAGCEVSLEQRQQQSGAYAVAVWPQNCDQYSHPALIVMSGPSFSGPLKSDPSILTPLSNGDYMVLNGSALVSETDFMYNPLVVGQPNNIAVISFKVLISGAGNRVECDISFEQRLQGTGAYVVEVRPENCDEHSCPTSIVLSGPRFPGPLIPNPSILKPLSNEDYLFLDGTILVNEVDFMYDPLIVGQPNDIRVISFEVLCVL